MTHYCLDACSLINLHCGWGGVQELHVLGGTWSTSDAAARECRRIREFHDDGSIITRDIESAEFFRGSPLVVHAATDEEMDTAMRLAASVDDGEAECLALAKHRELVFVSDDLPAIRLAEAEGIETITFVSILRSWVELDSTRMLQMPDIAGRISALARHVPSPSNPELRWWTRACDPSQT
ncbi:hypothetical protein [Pseudoxanthomonas sp.]|uniref:hypothetical protein n=1 Tax=Pseudoxanthomonas sp. TaxID=1871049 RepID=UPI002FE30221